MDKKPKKKPPITKLISIIRLIIVINTMAICLCVSIAIAILYLSSHSPVSISTAITFLIFVVLVVASFIFFLNGYSKDGMTKIYNADAMYLFQINKIIMKQASEYCAVYLNLKNFKYVNRLVENTGGDIVLMKYAQTLKKFLMGGEICARLGGDNFAVMIYKYRIDGFLKIIECLDIKINLDGEDTVIPIYSRAGIYSVKDGDNIGDIMGNISIAMINAKSGRYGDVVWFSESMKDEHDNEKSILYAFNNALDNKEFKVYYQPKVDIETGCLCGCEALARWEKDGEILPPVRFVPSLEKNKRIAKLDFYMLDVVCQDIARWIEAGINPVCVSLNFSKTHLTDARLIERILSIINKYKIDKKYIQIELTESADVDDYGNLVEFLERMKYEKVSTALDDFGIGYSSLELLRNEYIDVIKLDKSFIDNIAENGGENDSAYLVRNIIHSCYDLGKEIVCEGVETVQQRDLLKRMHCSIVQGFLYDKPLPVSEFENRLKTVKYSV